MGGLRHQEEKSLSSGGAGKSHLCDRKRKGREKNSGSYSRTETNEDRGRIKEKGGRETRGKGREKEDVEGIKQDGLGRNERKLKTGDSEIKRL